jgi:hypothetical protein
MTTDPELIAERAILAYLYGLTGDPEVRADTLEVLATEVGADVQAWRAVAEYAARQCAYARAVVDAWSGEPTQLSSAIDFTECRVGALLPPLPAVPRPQRLRLVRDP